MIKRLLRGSAVSAQQQLVPGYRIHVLILCDIHSNGSSFTKAAVSLYNSQHVSSVSGTVHVESRVVFSKTIKISAITSNNSSSATQQLVSVISLFKMHPLTYNTSHATPLHGSIDVLGIDNSALNGGHGSPTRDIIPCDTEIFDSKLLSRP